MHGDRLDENTLYDAEWAGLSFHSPTNATIGSGFDSIGFALILDDDPRPPSSPLGGGVEGTRRHDLLVTVDLSAPSGQTVTVSWSTINTLAQPKVGVDFAPGSGTLTFAPGETSKTAPFVVHGDTVDEPGQGYGAE